MYYCLGQIQWNKTMNFEIMDVFLGILITNEITCATFFLLKILISIILFQLQR